MKSNRNERKKPISKSTKTKKVDTTLFLSIVGFCLFGLLAVFNASVVSAFRDFGNQFHFVTDQGIYLGVGLIGLIIISFVDYHVWYKLAIPLLFCVLILLLAVFIPGIGIKALGAKRWLNFGFFILQPTELAKFVLVIYFCAWFTYKERDRLIPFLLLLTLVVGLIILQPDLGTAIIIMAIASVLYFFSGAPISHFLILIPLTLAGGTIFAFAEPYRFARITTFFNVKNDPLGASYHLHQILLSLGSGGWFGVGLGKSRQKYGYLPEPMTDSVFAIIAEELGFIGAALIIGAFVFIALRSFQISQTAPDRFGQLLGSGIATWFSVQTLINLSSMVALIPLTGVPLPFISYGGSSLISILLGFGILLNISRQAKGT